MPTITTKDGTQIYYKDCSARSSAYVSISLPVHG